MYPIDLLKVRAARQQNLFSRKSILTCMKDADASRQSDTGGRLHWRFARHGNDITDGRRQDTLERCIQRHCWSRCAKCCHSATAGAELTAWNRPGACGILCHLRSSKACHGRKPRQRAPPSRRRHVNRSHFGILELTLPVATSGACATIASDALMNPFDGMITRCTTCRGSI